MLNKDQRQKCWDARDAYFHCLDQNQETHQTACQQLKSFYESTCPQSWVTYFRAKRHKDMMTEV